MKNLTGALSVLMLLLSVSSFAREPVDARIDQVNNVLNLNSPTYRDHKFLACPGYNRSLLDGCRNWEYKYNADKVCQKLGYRSSFAYRACEPHVSNTHDRTVWSISEGGHLELANFRYRHTSPEFFCHLSCQ